MKDWKVTLECPNKTIDVMLKAKTYSEAYIAAGANHPNCVIKSVSEIRKK